MRHQLLDVIEPSYAEISRKVLCLKLKLKVRRLRALGRCSINFYCTRKMVEMCLSLQAVRSGYRAERWSDIRAVVRNLKFLLKFTLKK